MTPQTVNAYYNPTTNEICFPAAILQQMCIRDRMNSWEMGVSTSLTFPRVVFPHWGKREFDFPATTTFRLYIDQLNRARSVSYTHLYLYLSYYYPNLFSE